MVTRGEVQFYTRQLIGAKWHHQGRSVDGGIDCIGGLIYVSLETGYLTPEQIQAIDRYDYSRTPTTYELLVQSLREVLDEIPISEARGADVLTFRMNGERLTSHVGIILNGIRELTLVHSLENKVTIEEPLRRWNKYITHAFRFRGILD